MTPELKAEIKGLKIKLDNRSLSGLIGVGEDTISGWGKRYRAYRGIQKEPIWVWHLVRAWKAHPELLREAIAYSHAAVTGGPTNHVVSD